MSVELSSPTRVRPRASTIAKIVVSVVLLAVLFSRVDTPQLWATARRASVPWLAAAVGIYALSMIASTWRWHVLLEAQDVRLPRRRLLGSYLVASFFNNFLPSNIGGDVVRITDTARAANSKTVATMVILVDRGLGLMGVVLIAALGATVIARMHGHTPSPIWPAWLWAGFFLGAAATAPAVYSPARVARVLEPLRMLHPEWVGVRIETLTTALGRFR